MVGSLKLSLGATLALAFFLSAAFAFPEDDAKELFRNHGRARKIPRFRLPEPVTPIHYKLVLQPILDEEPAIGERFTAPGEVWIDLEVNEEGASNITLNSVWINITQYRLWETNETGYPLAEITITRNSSEPEKEFYTIHPFTPLKAKSFYQLYMKYVAPITAPDVLTAGLYRTSYLDDNGNQRWLAVTDFESVDARRMVPCFDEPALKATWEVSIIRQKTYTSSLSNFNLRATNDSWSDKWARDDFETTFKMPTYLLGVTVSDYDFIEATSGIYRKPAKIWGPYNMLNKTGAKYAADLSALLLAKFEERLNYEYTFPKMDSVGLNDFSAGAMENWGMNTYRMIRLIYLEGESSWEDKFRMTNTISHELAHQWYGNLITMAWWDDIWLNEGFATYMANVAVEMAHPEFQMADWIVVDSVQYAFQADVRPSAHPLNYVGLETPTETRAGFTTITYDKGASVLRMIHQFLTEDIFYAGLEEYFKNHNYSNAAKDDLSDAFGAAAGADAKLPPGTTMRQVLDTWTTQTSFPLIHVFFDTITGGVTLSQERFVSDTLLEPLTPENETFWYVPISWQKDGDDFSNRTFWLNNSAGNVSLTPVGQIGAGPVVVLNPEQHGYYRVKYHDGLFERILRNFSTLPSTTQSAVIDDCLNLGFSRYDSLKNSLDVIPYLKDVRTYLPWHSFFTNMAIPNRQLLRTSAYYYFIRYMDSLITPAFQDIGFDYESTDEDKIMDIILLRSRLVQWSCNLKLSGCVQRAKTILNEYRSTGVRPLDNQPDLRPPIYCAAVATADAADLQGIFLFILNQYKADTGFYDTHQAALLRSLACTTDSKYLEGILELALDTSDESIRAPHRLVAMQAVAGNPIGLSVIKDFVTNNLDRIIENLGISAISSVISTISDNLYTTSDERWIQNFVLTNAQKLSSIMSSLKISENNVRNNINWHTKYYGDFRSWLIENQP